MVSSQHIITLWCLVGVVVWLFALVKTDWPKGENWVWLPKIGLLIPLLFLGGFVAMVGAVMIVIYAPSFLFHKLWNTSHPLSINQSHIEEKLTRLGKRKLVY